MWPALEQTNNVSLNFNTNIIQMAM